MYAIWDALAPLYQDDPQSLATLKKNKMVTLLKIASLQAETGRIDECIVTHRKAVELDTTAPAPHATWGLPCGVLAGSPSPWRSLKRGQELGKNQPGGKDPLAE